VSMMDVMRQMMAGGGQMNEDIIAAEMLLAAKTGVSTTALALTEASTPEVRDMLRRQLNECIDHHEKVYNYMESKGLYNAKDFSKQVQVDQQAAQQVMQMSDQTSAQ
jgi:similar to spore coat protein